MSTYRTRHIILKSRKLPKDRKYLLLFYTELYFLFIYIYEVYFIEYVYGKYSSKSTLKIIYHKLYIFKHCNFKIKAHKHL